MNMQTQAHPAGPTTLPAGLDLEAMADEAQQAWQVAAAAGKDSRALTAGHRAAALAALCRALHLNPLTNPLIYVTLNGKEVLYVTRQATDQIAARLGLHRETVEGPEVRDFAGTKLLYCKVRVTMPGPGGRSETAVATLPPADLVNAVMKVETKAKRRATLSMVGLGMMGEDDVEGAGGEIPVASDEPTEAQAKLSLDLSDCTVNRDVVDAWLRHRDALTRDGEDVRKAAWTETVKVLMRLMETTKTAAEKYIRGAIAERDEAIRAARTAELSPPKSEGSAVEPTPVVEVVETVAKPVEADPPTLSDFTAQMERCATLDAVAELWRAQRGELPEGDRATAWATALSRLAVVMRAQSTAGMGALLKKRIAELDGPKPPTDPTPTGTDAPRAASPSAEGGAVAPSATAGAQASANDGPRCELTDEEREARYLRADAVGAAAWSEHLAACGPVFAMAGAHTKRAEAFRAAGVLATRRAQTLDAIEAREGRGPEAALQCLDGYRTRRVIPLGASVRARTHREIAASFAALKTAVGQ